MTEPRDDLLRLIEQAETDWQTIRYSAGFDATLAEVVHDRLLAAHPQLAATESDDTATIERVTAQAWHEFRYPRPALDEPTEAFKRAIGVAVRALQGEA